MIIAGVDVGNKATKAVLIDEGKVLSWALMNTRGDINKLAELVIGMAAEKAGLKFDDIVRIVATGAGGKEIKFTKEYFTSTLCSCVGSSELFSVCGVFDVNLRLNRVDIDRPRGIC